MKSISASIVVFAAAAMITGGAFVRHIDSRAPVQLIGGALGIIGLVVWFNTLKDEG